MSILWRARAALFKGLTMGAFGLFVLASAVWSYLHGLVPEAYTMCAIGMLAPLGVFGSGSTWPDLLVAITMASLGISAAIQVIKKASAELKAQRVILSTSA